MSKNLVPILAISGFMYYMYNKEKAQAAAVANAAAAQNQAAQAAAGAGGTLPGLGAIRTMTKTGPIKLNGLGVIRPNRPNGGRPQPIRRASPPVFYTSTPTQRSIGDYYDGVCGLGSLGFSFGNLFKTAAKGIEEATINPLQVALRVADAPIKLATGSSFSSVRESIEAPVKQAISTVKSASPSVIMARSSSGGSTNTAAPTVLPTAAGYIYGDINGNAISQAQYNQDQANGITTDVAVPIDTSGATTYAYVDMNGNQITSTQFNTDVANGILTDIQYPATANTATAPIGTTGMTPIPSQGMTNINPPSMQQGTSPAPSGGGRHGGSSTAASSGSKLPWILGGGAALIGSIFMFKH